METDKVKFEQISSKIEKITNQVTDVYIQNIRTELSALMEKKKLTLWITGLGTALELFLLNGQVWSSMSVISATFFIVAGALFLINAISTLYFNKMFTTLYGAQTGLQLDYNLQRLKILNSLIIKDSLRERLTIDLESNQLPERIVDFAYLKKEPLQGKSILKLSKWMVNRSDGNATFILLFQAVITLLFFLVE